MESNNSDKVMNNNKRFLAGLSTEMAFVIKIIDHSPFQDKKLFLENIASSNFNWMTFLQLSKKHHLTALLAEKIEQYSFDFIPSVISQALKAQIGKNQIRSEQLAAELLKILNLLKQNNIIALPFKGPTLAAQLYENSTSRFSRDIDFLVQKHEMSKTLKILYAAGYKFQKPRQSPRKEQAYQDYNGQYLMFSEDASIAIEPHSMLGPSTLALEVDYKQFWQQQIRIDFEGQNIPSFKIEDLFIILCIHGSKEKRRRLKWIIDIATLLEKYPELNWDYILKQTKNWGCRRMVLVALSVAQRILNASLPVDIENMLKNEKFVDYLAKTVEENIENTDPDLSSIYDLSLFIFLIRERNKDKISYLLRTIFTPREHHYELINLPDFMFFCYPVVKIIHDYLLLPVWNLRKIAFIK